MSDKATGLSPEVLKEAELAEFTLRPGDTDEIVQVWLLANRRNSVELYKSDGSSGHSVHTKTSMDAVPK